NTSESHPRFHTQAQGCVNAREAILELLPAGRPRCSVASPPLSKRNPRHNQAPPLSIKYVHRAPVTASVFFGRMELLQVSFLVAPFGLLRIPTETILRVPSPENTDAYQTHC